MKKAKEITKTSILDLIDYMMAGIGLTREQAVLAMETVVLYVQAHPGERVNRMISQILGRRNDRSEAMN